MHSKWCDSDKLEPQLKDIRNFKEAKENCAYDQRCGMLVDLASEHEKYSLCNFNADIFDSSVSSTLYLKCKINKH